ncbi:MAG: succinate dehydrogenase, hydrophobic membrane anchor protein [Pseudomonadota bacterium]|nr:succinate dehydrogenase, hydrophobic membrane anchor protein [Pseudomonadota bacterium]
MHGATGLRAWVVQRLSAIYMAVFILLMLGVFIFSPPADYTAWRGLMSHTLVSVAVLLFYLSVLIHAWVGVRDILIDYVQWQVVRLLLLALFGLMFVASGLWLLEVMLLARINGI